MRTILHAEREILKRKMADESHLERMGRELKCPICLSLLNSAVSLTCNHVFCNSCIQKSMKASSNCPVCKVPFRRREIRPAPHMDNLVSVYKSMEVASGVNIFVTQTAASTKVSGEDNQAVTNIGETQDNGKTQLESLDCENVKKSQRKGSKTASMTNQRAFGSNIVKSSFPTKKRVQLPMCPTSENRLQHENLGSEIGETGRNSPKTSHALQEDMPSACEKGEVVFPPFFWLREEEDEKSSQQTDDDQLMYTPLDAPCFSDIKESDDEGSRKLGPERGTCILPSNADFVDSEMFDWTQRPCSPELCSSPLAMQIEDTADDNEVQENADASLKNETTGLKTSCKHREGTGNKRRAGKISDKKVNVQSGNRQSKRAKKTCNVTSVHIEPDKVTDQDVQDGNKDKLMKFKGKPRQNKLVLSEASVQETASENVLAISRGTETMTISNKTAFPQFSASEDLKRIRKRSSKLKTDGKKCKSTKKTSVQSEKFGSEIKAEKSKTGKVQINTEKNNEVLISKPKTNLLPLGKDEEVSERGKTRYYEDNIRQSTNSRKKVKFCEEGMSRDNCESNPVTASDAARGKKLQEIRGAIDQGMKVQAKLERAMPNMKESVLVKCKTFPSESHCAFCLSSEESEASGIMVHYLKGKLVADNQITRTDTIHVHKTCTEWAPNVYFDGDDVFNLETELSRSRRIKCSCCGIKGAALGCYEKSCRKSFHVRCAKLTPECRWDYENFVMLCPLHASCQLPNEMPLSESKHKRQSADKSKSCLQVKTTAESKSSSTLQWKSQKKFKNLVLCCSALTDIEKGIVSEYEKLSGVTILKNWDSSVTHVIASTDENGACRRTLKFLMGVLEGKWILSVQWIKACIEAGELVAEHHYEISVDIHGIRDGPRLGRLRLLNKQPKLFNGYTFFFTVDFAPSYKGYLHDLVIAAGGKVLNRKPVAGCSATTFIIYSLELLEKCKPSDGNSILNQRRTEAEALATSAAAAVATNSWILNSISGYKLQHLAD